ncbi:unnamed protein product [Caenorhabditis brenneri]
MSTLLSLFCPLCRDPYDDTNKRPCLGTCLHNVCNSCVESSGTTKCPICDKENAFTIVLSNHELENDLLALNEGNIKELLEELTLNPLKLKIGSCKSGKKNCPENLRMCVNCAENSKLLQKLPNGEYEIIEEDKLIHFSKAVFYCSVCIADGLPDHRTHVFLRLSEINVTDMNLDFWYYNALVSVVKRKLTELSEKPAFTASEMFNSIVLKFKREALNFEAVTKPNRFGWMMEQFRFTRQKAVDIHSIPELAEAKEKSVTMAKEVIDRIEKVLERQLWMKKEELNRLARTNMASEYPEPEGFIDEMFKKFCSHIQQTSPALLPTATSMATDHKVFMKEIRALSKKFNSLKITDLTKSEAAYIDQKVDRKMSEAVQKLGLPEGTSQKLLNYKALCNILQSATDNMDKIREQTMEEITCFEDYFVNRMSKLENIINKETEEAKLTLRLFLFEVTENSFVVDRLLLKSLEAIHEFCEAQLLWSRESSLHIRMPALLSLFCPFCKSLYDDTDKRPRLGTCLHNVCNSCIEFRENNKCPICDKENAFTNVAYNHGLESCLVALHSENYELHKKLCSSLQKLSTGSCKAGKEECTETIRICVTCAEKSKLFKKLPDGEFEIIEKDKLIYLAKAIFYCSDCIADGLPDHRNHVFLRLSEINVIEMDLELWYFSAILSVFQRKTTELSEKSAITASEWMNNIVVKFKREAMNFEAVTKPDRFGWMLEQFRFTQQKTVDIHSIPELDQAKQKSVEMAREVIDRIKKVLERQLWIRKEESNQLTKTPLVKECPDTERDEDDTKKRPRFGTCLQNICNSCINASGNTRCPICNTKDAFENVSYNHDLERSLIGFNESSTEELLKQLAANPMKLSIGSCKGEKKNCSENLRMCVTCAETSKLFKKLPNGDFRILEHNKLIHLAKAVLYCSDCAADGPPDHPNHMFLRLSEINVVKMNLEFWNYIIHAMPVEKQLTEASKKPSSTASEMYNSILLKYKREALNFEAMTKTDRFGWMLEQFRFSQQKAVDIHSIPELSQAKEKSVEMAREVIDRINKVLERQLWIRKAELNQLKRTNLESEFPEPEGFIGVIFNKLRSTVQQITPDWFPVVTSLVMDNKVFMREITDLSKKYNSLKITDLTDIEAADIDKKIDEKMRKEVEKLGLPEGTSQKFLLYKALCNILQDASDNMNKIREHTLEEMARFEDFFARRMKELKDVINKAEEAKLTLRLFLFEVTENSFVVDRLLLKSLEAIEEFCEAQLLWVRFSLFVSEAYLHNSLIPNVCYHDPNNFY